MDDFFARMRGFLEPSYLAADEPWKQSGFSGPEARWIALRKPVADCIDRAGSFLDLGCANGYLVECVVRWTAARGHAVDPWGIDLSPPLVALAQRRLPALADRFTVANAATFAPSRRFDFVRTELCYVPADEERAYVNRLQALGFAVERVCDGSDVDPVKARKMRVAMIRAA